MSRDAESLLNAYLDGELTADEQAAVERQLADSAELRQLHEELRALRVGLEALPQYRLPAGFADRVVQLAEQARRQADDCVPADAVVKLPRSPGVARPTRFSWIKWGSWCGAAVAALLVIAIYHPEPAAVGDRIALPLEPAESTREKPAQKPAYDYKPGTAGGFAFDTNGKFADKNTDGVITGVDNEIARGSTMEAAPSPPIVTKPTTPAARKPLDHPAEEDRNLIAGKGKFAPPGDHAPGEDLAQSGTPAIGKDQNRELVNDGKNEARYRLGGPPMATPRAKESVAELEKREQSADRTAPGVWIVHVDLTAEGARTNALNRLLTGKESAQPGDNGGAALEGVEILATKESLSATLHELRENRVCFASVELDPPPQWRSEGQSELLEREPVDALRKYSGEVGNKRATEGDAKKSLADDSEKKEESGRAGMPSDTGADQPKSSEKSNHGPSGAAAPSAVAGGAAPGGSGGRGGFGSPAKSSDSISKLPAKSPSIPKAAKGESAEQPPSPSPSAPLPAEPQAQPAPPRDVTSPPKPVPTGELAKQVPEPETIARNLADAMPATPEKIRVLFVIRAAPRAALKADAAAAPADPAKPAAPH